MKKQGPNVSAGFTLIELLVVLAIIGVLAAMLLPALVKAKAKGQSIGCLNNLKQLQLGWHMYAQDNHDTCIRITSRYGQDVPPSWILGNAQAGHFATNIQSGLLFNYVPGLGSYLCPADVSRTKEVVPAPRVRSYSISAYLNHDYVGKSGSWSPSVIDLDLQKTASIAAPVEMFVFVEEHPDSIDDGAFEVTNMAADETWWELPTDRHQLTGNFAFADGHMAARKWKWPKKFSAYHQPFAINSSGADLEDLRWVQRHLPANRLGFYPQ